MKWSKLKKNIEDKFADSLRGRVQIYTTRYTIASTFMVRAWITIDGVEIANFSTPDHYAKYGWNDPDIDKRINDNERTPDSAVEKGEFSQWDFVGSCNEYLNLKVTDAISSDNPILKALAVLDSRTGKRSLEKIRIVNDLHPLVEKMLNLRLESEGLIRLCKH